MNSKLRNIDAEFFENKSLKNILHNLAWNGTYSDAGQTVISDIAVAEAEKAIRQAVGEEMLELVEPLKRAITLDDGGDDEVTQDFIELVELRQKIKQWQGGEDE